MEDFVEATFAGSAVFSACSAFSKPLARGAKTPFMQAFRHGAFAHSRTPDSPRGENLTHIDNSPRAVIVEPST